MTWNKRLHGTREAIEVQMSTAPMLPVFAQQQIRLSLDSLRPAGSYHITTSGSMGTTGACCNHAFTVYASEVDGPQ
jgi:hypothetical protein